MTGDPVELRSDTFTRPTPAMRQAMAQADVGDDVWGEDPTVQVLERCSAELMGKEAGLFVSSGTQGNLLGLLAHTQRGDEVLVGDQSHIIWYESPGAAVVGGLQIRTLRNTVDGRLEPDEVRAAIRPADIHFPRTSVLALENTHNRCGGAVLTLDYTREVAGIAHDAGLHVHLDGARIFNASQALGVAPRDLATSADSVTFCLSKALGAPVGSVLCGDGEFIERARRWRKIVGGGMRQVGVLAAAGLVALEQQVERLREDHANARHLARGLAEMPGIQIDPEGVQSNIVAFTVAGTGLSAEEICRRLGEYGVRMAPVGPDKIRAVTSYEVDAAGIERALQVLARTLEQPAPALA